MKILILSLICIKGFASSVAVRDGCGEDASVLVTIQQSDAIRVEHGVVGESVPCYAVSLDQSGSTVRGYISDGTLPVVVEFERKRALESRVPIPEPAAAPTDSSKDGKKVAMPKPTGPPFEAWVGADINGKRMQIGAGNAKITLVTFWSAPNPTARHSAETIMKTEAEFRAKGLKVYGMTTAMNSGKLGYYMDDMGLDYPVAMDRQGLAAKYGADPSKGTTLVIDASNHIIASSSDPKEIRAAVLKLLSSE
jgi:hypothetical protein